MDFAFIINSPDYTYVQKKFKIAKYLPKSWIEWWCKNWPPIIVSEVTGLKSKKDNREITGCLIGIPMTSSQMLEFKELAIRRVVKACEIAEKKGVKLIGLGAFPSHITKGGLELIKRGMTIPITNGRTLTAIVAVETIKKVLQDKNAESKNITIAIIGATDLLGKGISKSLARIKFKKLILIGKTPDNLSKLELEIKNKFGNLNEILITTDIDKIREADIIIIAITSTKIIIKPNELKYEAVIYDVSQPRNTPPSLTKQRPDIKLIDGSLISTPNVDFHFNFGPPKEVAFSCLTETMLLSAEGKYENLAGDIDLNEMQHISETAKKYNFKSYIKYISDSD